MCPQFQKYLGSQHIEPCRVFAGRTLLLVGSSTPGWGFHFLKSAYSPLIHTIPAFKMLLLCPLLLSLPSILLSFYLPTAKCSGVFRAHVAKHVCSICQVKWNLLTSFYREEHWSHSSWVTCPKPGWLVKHLEPSRAVGAVNGPSSLPCCLHDYVRKPTGLKVSLADIIAGFFCTAQEILGYHCLFQP